MDKLWAWLKQANARAVFLCALGALGVVVAWWAWKMMTPIQVPSPAAPVSAVAQASPGLGLLAILDAQPAASPLKPPASPFAPPERRQSSKPPPPPPVKVAPPPPEVVKHASVIVTYRGMLQRADGVRLALIEDSITKRAIFYQAGTNVCGLNIKHVDPEQIELVLKNHSPATLKRGVARSFEEGKDAD